MTYLCLSLEAVDTKDKYDKVNGVGTMVRACVVNGLLPLFCRLWCFTSFIFCSADGVILRLHHATDSHLISSSHCKLHVLLCRAALHRTWRRREVKSTRHAVSISLSLIVDTLGTPASAAVGERLYFVRSMLSVFCRWLRRQVRLVFHVVPYCRARKLV